MAGLLTDYVGVSIKDIADLYVNINQSKLNAGLQKQQNTINQLVAQTELTRQQQKLAESLTVDPQAAQRMPAMDFDTSKMMSFALLGVGAFLLYKLIK